MVGNNQPLQLFDELMFPKIFQAFRMAVQPGKLAIALLGVAVIFLLGYTMDSSNSVIVGIEADYGITELDVYMGYAGSDKTVPEFRLKYEEKGLRAGVFSILWRFGSERFHAALRALFEINLVGVATNIADYFRAVGWAMRYHYVYCSIFALIKLAVISVVGGAICRIAALQLARAEKPGLAEALRFSLNRFTSFFFAPLVPCIAIAVIGAFIFAVGLAGRIPYAGGLIVAVLTLLLLILGTLIATIMIGAVAGFNLMFPAVAYDGSDAFDAISRSFSYVFSRPWRMAFYTAISAVYGAVCYIAVRLFAFLLLWVTRLILSLGIGLGGGEERLSALWPEPKFPDLIASNAAAATGAEYFAACIIYLFLCAVAGLVIAVVISFYFSANTITYSLMRNKVDNAAIDEVYSDSEDLRIDPMTTPDEAPD